MIDYESGTSFHETFELRIMPSNLFRNGMFVEVIPWTGNIFNITKIRSVIHDEFEGSSETKYHKLKHLTQEQQDFIRDNLAKHYIRHRGFMLLTEGMFKLEEDITKYGLRDHNEGY